MPEFVPVMTVADFRQLDDGEILEGYFDGFHGDPAPGSDRWRNGRVDAGLADPDFAQVALRRAFRSTTGTSH